MAANGKISGSQKDDWQYDAIKLRPANKEIGWGQQKQKNMHVVGNVCCAVVHPVQNNTFKKLIMHFAVVP
jgi:hypothetical protein